MRYLFLLLSLLLALPTQAAEQFVDKRFNLELFGTGKSTAGWSDYLTPTTIRGNWGRDYIVVHHCKLWENRQSFLRYYCLYRYEYENCAENAQDLAAIEKNCTAKKVKIEEIYEFTIKKDKYYHKNRHTVSKHQFDIAKRGNNYLNPTYKGREYLFDQMTDFKKIEKDGEAIVLRFQGGDSYKIDARPNPNKE